MTKLNDLHDNPGARKSRVRVGRGIGSGVGKTAGRGQKGQTSRSGVSINGFEGGQMPLHMRLPKRGFNNIFRKDYAELNLGTLQAMVDAGRLDATALIDADALVAAGVITNVRDGIHLLAKGSLTAKLSLKMAGASAAAKAAVEAAGGSLELPAPKPAPRTRDEQKADRAVARAAKAAAPKAR
jgi:large subunit ribosomal protein L15